MHFRAADLFAFLFPDGPLVKTAKPDFILILT